MFDSRDRDDSRTGGPDAGTLRYRYDWRATRASMAVVEMVAIASDREPAALDPLYETVDPEALDALVRREDRVRTAAETVVEFEYAGYDVTVRSDGEVMVAPDRPNVAEE